VRRDLAGDRTARAGRQGAVQGSSNFAGWHIVQANEAASSRNFLGLVSEQCKYNITVRSVELEVLPACDRYGLGVIAWSPLAGGSPEVPCRRRTRPAPERAGRSEIERRRSQLEAYEKLCADAGESPDNVALGWLLANPAVTAPIIGPRTVGQLDDTIRATEISLGTDLLERVDEIFPSPGGPAPEAWVW
jgi:NDP-hexose C3-ketoreductase / dTDP-4-oxo-2-deoxy-alpha-D-pentos-2-ene 2,3-reductase